MSMIKISAEVKLVSGAPVLITPEDIANFWQLRQDISHQLCWLHEIDFVHADNFLSKLQIL